MIYLALLNALLPLDYRNLLAKDNRETAEKRIDFFLRQGIHYRAPTNNAPELFSQKKVYGLQVVSNLCFQ